MNNTFLSITLLGFFAAINVLAQDENPADRYIDAYRQYLEAGCPIKEDSIKHFVYFARDRDLIHNHPFLKIHRFKGAQIMYAWKQLEPEKGQYDFSIIQEDYNYLLSHGKKLFMQLQDATFNPKYVGIPDYLLTEEYDGGSTQQYSENGIAEGWVAKRWNPRVQNRFALLLTELGKEFDGKIEGINLQESAVGVTSETDTTFTPELYMNSIKINMLALKKSFPISITMQYANFMPGEWLPWENMGYLRSVYQFGQETGVGLGSPDLMVQRRGHLNHAIAMMHENNYTVPLGIAVQDGNYIGKTGSDHDYNEHEENGVVERGNMVPLLHAFAKDFLNVSYMFWVYQEPYFSEDVIPCFLFPCP
jgi:hypothetical protein